MSFLTPLFLIGGLAIAAPIIYHLIRQTTRDKTNFSSLMFLLPSPPRISTRHRLEHILLLILRCLALLLLAFGFARPFLTQTELNDPTAAQPKRMVVLLDRSASMRRDGVWAAARTRVEEILRRAGPADQVAIYTFDRQATSLLNFDEWNRTAAGDRVAMAVSRLGGVTPGWLGTQLGSGLITAAEALGENDGKVVPGPRQIFLVSDLQAGSRLDTLQAYEWPKGVELFVEAVKATKTTNAGVQLVAESTETNRAADAPVRVRVTNAADSKGEQFKLGWVQAGATPTEFVSTPIDAYVSPGQAKVFAVPMPPAGTPATHIALRGDDEAFDNTLAVIPPTQQRANVVWLGADATADSRQPLYFLNRAFVDTPRVAVQIAQKAPAAPLNAAELQAAHLIFVADALPQNSAAAVREQVNAGKVALVVAKNPEISATLETLVGKPGARFSEAKVSNGYAMFTDIDFQHPLFAPFADPRYSDFTKIHVWRYRKLEPNSIPEARVVVRLDSGDPLLLEVPVGKGKIFVLTSGWQPEDSQVAISSKFVPLMWSLLELGGGVVTASTQFFVGEKLALPPGMAATSVKTPAGKTTTLTAGQDFTQADEPGIYEFTGGARPVRIAVNLEPNESRTSPLDADELERLGVPVARPAVVAAASPTESKTMLQGIEAESRQKLWRWFIAATLVILLAESALAGWTARRTASRAAEGVT
jgi:hypothetical protein